MRINQDLIPIGDEFELAARRLGRRRILGFSLRRNRSRAGVLAERFMMADISMEMCRESAEDVVRFITQRDSNPLEVVAQAEALLAAIREDCEWAVTNVPWVLRRGYSHAAGTLARQTSGRLRYSFPSGDVRDVETFSDPQSGAEMRILERKEHFYTGKTALTAELTPKGVGTLRDLAAEGMRVALALESDDENQLLALEHLADEHEEHEQRARTAGVDLYDLYRSGKPTKLKASVEKSWARRS